MGHRRARGRQASKWTAEEEIELLAHVDDVRRTTFGQDLAVERIGMVLAPRLMRYGRSGRAIIQRLSNLVERYGAHSVQELCDNGTDCLRSLPTEMKNSIRSQRKALEMKVSPKLSTDSVRFSPRRPRSESHTPRHRSRTGGVTPTPSRLRVVKTENPTLQFRDIELCSSPSKPNITPSVVITQAPRHKTTSLDSVSDVLNIPNAVELSPSAIAVPHILETPEAPLSSASHECSSTFLVASSLSLGEANREEAMVDLNVASSLSYDDRQILRLTSSNCFNDLDCLPRPTLVVIETKALQELLQNNLSTRTEARKAKEEEEIDQRHERLAHFTRKELETRIIDYETTFKRKNKTIDALIREKNFKFIPRTPKAMSNGETIRTKANAMYRTMCFYHQKIFQAFRDLPTMKSFRRETLIDSPNLKELALNMGGEELYQHLHSTNKEQTVLTLVGAAICQWVLLPPFHCYSTFNTPLFEMYRQLIGKICEYIHEVNLPSLELTLIHGTSISGGELNHRELEIQAHAGLIETAPFDSFKIRLAESFACRFLHELRLHDDAKSSSSIMSSPKDVFLHTIELKLWGMISDYDYFIIWPRCNSSFVNSCMTTLDDYQSSQFESKAPHRMVLSPLVPGLRAVESQKIEVDYGSFSLKAESEDRIIAPAIVAV